MFRSVPMVRLRVQVPAKEAARATRAIAAAGLLHLVDIAHGQGLPGGAVPECEELLSAYRDLGSRIRRAAARLSIPLSEFRGALPPPECDDFAVDRVRIEEAVAPIEACVEVLFRRCAAAADRLRRLQEASRRRERLQAAGVPIERLSRLRFARIRFLESSRENLLALSRLLAPAPHAVLPIDARGENTLAGVAVESSALPRLDEALRVVPCEDYSPSMEVGEETSDALRAAVDEDAAARRDFAEKAANFAGPLIDLSRRVEVATLLLQAQSCFAAAGRFVVIAGWVPQESSTRLVAALRAACGEHAVIDVERPETLREASDGVLRAPILHRNPLLLRPFQRLVGLFGTPSYSEVEPTAFFALSFLLMFGVMFGDAGHGLVLFSAGFFLFRYFPRFLDYGILLMEAGVASTVFGVLFGSFFGIEGLLPVVWMSPLKDLRRFLELAIALGVVLVSTGLVINVVNGWRSGDRLNALLGPRGLFGAFVYWVMLAVILRAVLPGTFTLPAWTLFALLGVAVGLLVARPWLVRWLRRDGPPRPAPSRGPVVLVLLEAAVELVDTVFAYFANTLSFVRVAAFAAVHAGVFFAVFALADTVGRLRFGGGLSIMTLAAGNAVMILLEGLAVSVQVLRLEYYEFFDKFFRGGGEPYRPLVLQLPTEKGESR
jgi:V/A-type H+-transporting ATPase subunit I